MVTFSLPGDGGCTAFAAQVHGRCLQAGTPLTVRVFDRTAWAMSCGNWYCKESPRTKLFLVRLWSDMRVSRMKKWVR